MTKEEDKEVKLLGLLKDRYSRSAQRKEEKLREMEECRLFFRGDHWLQPVGNKYIEPEEEEWRVRLTVNKLPAAVDSAISTFLGQKPIIVTTSPTDDTQDREAAKVSEHVIMHYWDELDIQDIKLYDLCQWMFVCGTSFLRPYWDVFKGNEIALEGIDKNGETVEEMVQEGDLDVEVIDPFSLSQEPGATDIDDAAWIIVTESMLRSEVEDRFGIELKDNEDQDDDSDLGDDLGDDRFVPLQLDQYRETSERIYVHTMYDRPTKKMPKGRVVYSTTDQILRVDERLPVKIGDDYVIPIVKFDNILLPGEFWSTSMVSQAIPLQAAYNRLRSQIIENRNLMSRPQWIAPEGSIELDSIEASPGLIIPFDPVASAGIIPQQAQVYHTDPTHFNELGSLINDMDDITSRHDVSMGRQSSDITSGKHAEALQKADDSRYGPCIKIFEKKLARFARMMLGILKEHAANKRVLKIMGDSRAYEVREFDQNDITDRANIKFEISSQMPWSRDAMRQTAVWMFSQKLLDQEGLMELLQFPTMRGMYEPAQQHRLNARQENVDLERELVRPFPSDDHKVHMEEHDKVLNDPRYRDRFKQERKEMEQYQKTKKQFEQQQQQAQQMGMPPSGMPPQQPQLLYFNLIQHQEQHRKGMPAGKPEPPQKRVNVNISSQDLPPEEASKLAQDAAGSPAPSAGEKKSGPEAQTGLAKPMGSPEGGMSGEMYSPQGGKE